MAGVKPPPVPVRIALRLASTRFGGWFCTTILPPIDRYLLLRFKGQFSISSLGTSILLLTTYGRNSGLERTTPLMYIPHNGGFAVIGLNGCRAPPPAWWLNLEHRPEAKVEIAGQSLQVRAQPLSGTAYQQLWQQFVAFNPGFNQYRTRAERSLPIVLLTPH